MGRILAIDYGLKRTGLAVTDSLQLIANGLTTVRTVDLEAYLVDYISKESVEAIVVGLPKQLNNQDSQIAPHVDGFVRRLQSRFPELSVVRYDERFTSVRAHQTILDAGLGRQARQNKALVDTVSATILLQDYLESKRFSL